MTTATMAVTAQRARARPFYLIMALVLAGIAIRGFSRTIPGDLSTPGFPALLWVHAAVFTSWVVLFVAQPALIMAGSLRWHRRLGWVGTGLAVAMVALGAIAVLMGLISDNVPPFYPHGLFLMRGMIALATFAGLVIAGIVNRRRPEWHKRFLLCASFIVVLPGLERAMPLEMFGTAWPFAVDATIDGLALAGPVVDLVARRRIHPAYLWGVGAIMAGQAAVYVLAPSAIAVGLLHALGTN
jgi:FtsH-binding integral membrane protein